MTALAPNAKSQGENTMNKTLIALAAAGTIAVAAIASPGQAQARGWHGGGWHGGGWGPGIVGGLAAGALLGGAYGYGYGPGYYGYGPGPYAYGGGCYVRRHWTPYGWRWRRFCY